jgi:Coenzyme PQQ synthesis protein D (PqqD)
VPVQYCRASGTVWRSAHGAVLVLPIADHDMRALGGAGADLWQLLSQPLTLDQAAYQLAEVYDMSPNEIIQEIAPVLDDLAAHGVLDRLS